MGLPEGQQFWHAMACHNTQVTWRRWQTHWSLPLTSALPRVLAHTTSVCASYQRILLHTVSVLRLPLKERVMR